MVIVISAATLRFETTVVKRKRQSQMTKSGVPEMIWKRLSISSKSRVKLQISLNLGLLPEGPPKMKKWRRVLRTMLSYRQYTSCYVLSPETSEAWTPDLRQKVKHKSYFW